MPSSALRTRSRNGASTLNQAISLNRSGPKKGGSIFCATAGTPSVVNFSMSTTSKFHESIQDTKNWRDTDGDLPQGNVLHFKCKADADLTTKDMEMWYWECNETVTPVSGTKVPVPVAVMNTWLAPPLDSLLTFHCDKAFNEFYQQWPEEISIANAIWELKEVAQLIVPISNSAIKNLNNAYLSYEFGWKPLIGDIKAMMDISQRVSDRIAYLKERKGKLTRMGYYRDNFHSLSSGSNVVTGNLNCNGTIEARLVKYSSKFSAGGRLFHTMDDLDEDYREILAYMGAFGLTNPAKIIWNAIPYSFIVDWISNVSNTLTRYSTLQDQQGWKIDRMSWSYTQVWDIDIWMRQTVQNKYGDSRVTPWKCGSVRYKRYRRENGLSVGNSLIGLTDPTYREQALLAALILGKYNS